METSEYILWRNQNRGVLKICLIKFGLSRSSFYSLYERLALKILKPNIKVVAQMVVLWSKHNNVISKSHATIQFRAEKYTSYITNIGNDNLSTI